MIGALVAAQILAVWLIYLDKTFGPGFNWRKLAWDQLFMNPIITGSFIWLVGIANGVELKASISLITKELPDLSFRSRNKILF